MTDKLRGKSLVEPFREEACVLCGRCLSECPVMKLPEREAKKEMAALRAGVGGRHVLKKCETCLACNVSCPNGANPAMLFIERFYERHAQKGGLPAWSGYFQPHESTNFRTTVITKLPEDEKKLLEKWADLSPCEEFAYPGCNLCTAPYLTRAGFLEGLNIRGGLQYCCGEMYFRTGMLDQLRQTAARMNNYFKTLGAKRMMVLCTAGYNLFSNVLPQYGLTADVEITSYIPWLWERLSSGEIPIKKQLKMSVTVQEPCHAKIFGPEYYELPRKILAHIGVEIREMTHNRDCAYCCGIGGGFPVEKSYHPLAIAASTIRVVAEARRAGADAVMTYCAGCMLSMSSLLSALPVKLPVYHIFELVQMAAGEKPLHRNMARGRQLLAGSIKNQMPRSASKAKIPFPNVPPEV